MLPTPSHWQTVIFSSHQIWHKFKKNESVKKYSNIINSPPWYCLSTVGVFSQTIVLIHEMYSFLSVCSVHSCPRCCCHRNMCLVLAVFASFFFIVHYIVCVHFTRNTYTMAYLTASCCNAIQWGNRSNEMVSMVDYVYMFLKALIFHR